MPMVSIIIPAWNNWRYTDACLEAIDRHTDGNDYEVIVVDNGSTDATAGQPVTIRNADNLGFAVACNQGANAAVGDVLVFLNQDTVPLPGWLDELLESFDGAVGIVGAKLLYPNGSLQHTGVSVDFKRPLGHEAVNYQTEQPAGVVDAVTGACLAIPRVLFHQLGGFDEGFRNGYEDVDLCLAARDLGKLVWYNPDAEVIHHESISGPERFAHVGHNVQRLRDKWDNT